MVKELIYESFKKVSSDSVGYNDIIITNIEIGVDFEDAACVGKDRKKLW